MVEHPALLAADLTRRLLSLRGAVLHRPDVLRDGDEAISLPNWRLLRQSTPRNDTRSVQDVADQGNLTRIMSSMVHPPAHTFLAVRFLYLQGLKKE